MKGNFYLVSKVSHRLTADDVVLAYSQGLIYCSLVFPRDRYVIPGTTGLFYSESSGLSHYSKKFSTYPKQGHTLPNTLFFIHQFKAKKEYHQKNIARWIRLSKVREKLSPSLLDRFKYYRAKELAQELAPHERQVYERIKEEIRAYESLISRYQIHQI